MQFFLQPPAINLHATQLQVVARKPIMLDFFISATKGLPLLCQSLNAVVGSYGDY